MEDRTSSDQEFIERSRVKAGLSTPHGDSHEGATDSKVSGVDSRPWYKRYSSWAGLSLILPFILVATFLMGINSIEQTFGVDSLRWLISTDKVQFVDVGWMRSLIQVYDYRWAICLGIFIFFTALSLLLMYLEYRRMLREEGESEE